MKLRRPRRRRLWLVRRARRRRCLRSSSSWPSLRSAIASQRVEAVRASDVVRAPLQYSTSPLHHRSMGYARAGCCRPRNDCPCDSCVVNACDAGSQLDMLSARVLCPRRSLPRPRPRAGGPETPRRRRRATFGRQRAISRPCFVAVAGAKSRRERAGLGVGRQPRQSG